MQADERVWIVKRNASEGYEYLGEPSELFAPWRETQQDAKRLTYVEALEAAAFRVRRGTSARVVRLRKKAKGCTRVAKIGDLVTWGACHCWYPVVGINFEGLVVDFGGRHAVTWAGNDSGPEGFLRFADTGERVDGEATYRVVSRDPLVSAKELKGARHLPRRERRRRVGVRAWRQGARAPRRV